MKINEIFYSLQGEGRLAGTPAVFVRFSGCNLACPFCDTDHKKGKQMSEEDIVKEVSRYRCEWVVLTGGEPALQVTENLIDKLHKSGKKVAIETNGTKEIKGFPDWVTCSPKDKFCKKAQPILKSCGEIKVVYNGAREVSTYPYIYASYYYLQPCDTGDKKKNALILKKAVNFIKKHPKWVLSLQIQKILNIR